MSPAGLKIARGGEIERAICEGGHIVSGDDIVERV